MADDSKDGSEKDRNAPTVRDLKGPSPVSADTIPDVVGQYVPPRAPPEASHHRTIDLKPVRLSDEADPRRWRTERRLVAPKQVETGWSALWLGAFALILVVLGAWALVSASAAPEEAAPPVAGSEVVPVAVTSAPLAATPAPDKSETPAARAAPLGSANAASQSKPSVPEAAPSAPKATRPRETERKRKDPWLE